MTSYRLRGVLLSAVLMLAAEGASGRDSCQRSRLRLPSRSRASRSSGRNSTRSMSRSARLGSMARSTS